MCGRFALAEPKPKIEHYYNIQIPFDTPMRFNIAPTDETLILCTEDKLPLMMHWGFLPFWAKNTAIKEQINAKSETLHEKPMFRQAFKESRCIVVASGYFEWIEEVKAGSKVKTPFYIYNQFTNPLSIAGIWSRNEITKQPGFAIVTTQAVKQVEKFHDRMPFILDTSSKMDTWLSMASTQQELQSLLSQHPDESFAMDQVSRLVNSVKNDSPLCVVSEPKI